MDFKIEKLESFLIGNKDAIMASIALIVLSILLVPTSAYAATPSAILNNVGMAALSIGGIVFIIFLVKGIVDITRGKGSLGDLVKNCAIILLITGLIVVATNIEGISQLFSGVSNSVVESVSETAEEVLS